MPKGQSRIICPFFKTSFYISCFPSCFSAVIHLAASLRAPPANKHFPLAISQSQKTIDTIFQVLTSHAHPLCRLQKYLTILSNFRAYPQIRTSFPQGPWKVFPLMKYRENLAFSSGFFHMKNSGESGKSPPARPTRLSCSPRGPPSQQ